MGKKRSFLGIFAFLVMTIFATNSFAAGYTCASYKKYTSCSEGYYLNGTGVGNACVKCPDNSSTTDGNTAVVCDCSTGYSVGGTPTGVKTTTTTACTAIATTFTLNNDKATTNGTTTIYARYGTDAYLDADRSDIMTTTANPITVPQRSYTVEYNANGGSVDTTSQTANYTFNGYYTAATGGIQIINASGNITSTGIEELKKATGDATLYAQWSSVSVTMPTPTRAGYIFNGWATSSSATSGDTGAYTPTDNNLLYATWTGAEYDCEAGTYWDAENVQCAQCTAGNYCEGVSGTNNGTDAGLSACPAGTSDNGAESMTDCYFDVTLSANGGSGNCATTKTCYFNQTCVLPSWDSTTCNLKNGTKTFQGWATSEGSVAGSYSMTFRSADTVYAAWAQTTCYATNGTATPANTVDNKPTCTITCNSGHGTSGTYSGSAGATAYSYTCTAGGYDVFYDCGEGSGTAPSNGNSTYGVDFAPAANTCTRTGYTFGGWAVSGTSDVKSASVEFKWEYTESKTLTATWNPVCNKITLANTTNGGTGGTVELYKKTDSTAWYTDASCAGTEITTLPTKPTKSNATYAGHYTGTAATGGTQYITADGKLSSSWTVTGKQTLTAQYSCNTNWTGSGTKIAGACTGTTYTITLNDNGGNGGSGTVKQVYSTKWTNASGTTITTVAIPTRSEYVFNGYYTATSNGTQRITKAGTLPGNTTFTANAELFAQWTKCEACAAGTGATCSLSVSGNACTYTTACQTGYKNIQNSGKYNPSCEPVSYTIEYNANGGSGTTTASNHTYNQAAPLTANGFTNGTKQFLGWAKASGATTAQYTNKQSVTNLSATDGDVVKLYAVWGTSCTCSKDTGVASCTATAPLGVCGTATATAADGYNNAKCSASSNGVSACTATANKYTVAFNPNGGEGTMNSQEFTYGKTQSLTKNTFTYEGLNFQGWATSATGAKVYDDAASVSNLTTENNGIFELYAVWGDAVSYTITYENMSGISNPNPTTFTVTTATFTLKNPERTGYTFDGWYKESTFDTKVTQIAKGTTGNQTLYAKWTPNKYTITYDCNGGTLLTVLTKKQTVEFEKDFTTYPSNACSRTGYTFDGWDSTLYPEANKTYTYTTVGDTTLAAKWKAIGYKCNPGHYLPRAKTECAGCPTDHYCAGGTYTYSTTADQGITGTCPDDYPISAEQSDAKEDCYKNVSVNQGVIPTNCHSATWAACTYQDYYGKDDTPCVPDTVTSVTAKKGAYVSGTTCVVCGANRYQTTDGTNATSCSATCASGYSIAGTSLSDHDEKSDCARTITLDKNGGSGNITTSVVCREGVSCDFGSASGLTQTGYTFTGGWGTSESCASTTTAFPAPSASTYYACKTANTYTVSFDANGGTGGQTATVTATYDSAMPEINTNAPTLSGYVFAGWFDAKTDGTQYYTAAGKSARSWNIAKDTTLYAQWVVGGMNTVTYNENGGTSVDDTECNVQSGDITLPAITRDNHTFDGWYNDETGVKTTVITSGTCVDEMSFTAKWTKCGECIKGTGVSSCSVNVVNNVCVATSTCANGYKTPLCDGLSCSCTPETYVVTYDCGDGSGTAPSDDEATYGDEFAPAANTCTPPTGYEFSFWKDGTNQHKAGVEFTWTYTSGKTLTAEYSVEGARDINYVTGGGEIRGSYTVSCNAQTDDFTLPQDVFLKGHKFLGWKDASGNLLDADYTVAKGTCTSELTFTAEWSKCTSTINGECGCDSNTHPENGVCVSCTTACSTLGAEYQGTYNVCANDGAGNAETQCYYESTMDCYAPAEDTYMPNFYDYYAVDCPDENAIACLYKEGVQVACKQYYNSESCEPLDGVGLCPLDLDDNMYGSGINCKQGYYRDGDKCVSCSSLGDGTWKNSTGGWYGPSGYTDALGVTWDYGCYSNYCESDCTHLLTDGSCPDGAECEVAYPGYVSGVTIYPSNACVPYSGYSCSMSLNCAPGYTSEYTDQYYEDILWTTKDQAAESDHYQAGTYSKHYKYFTCTPNLYYVSFNSNGGEGAIAQQTYTYDQEYTLPKNTLVRNGYKFIGWSRSKDGAVVFGDAEQVSNLTTDAGQTVVLYAVWELIEYSIVYHLNNGMNNAENMPTYTIVDTPIVLANPTKRGYDFAGWFSDEGLTEAVSEIPANATGNQEFWAKWTPIEYTITYNLDGGTNNPDNPMTYVISDTPIQLGKPTKTGFTFSKWVDANGITMTSIATDTIGDIVLNAVWASDSYVITYNLNGGTNNPDNPDTYTISDTPIYLAAPTKTGYIFDNWTGTKVKDNAIIEGTTGDTTVTANWTPTTFTVHFDSTDATDVSVPDVECTYDKACKAADVIEMLNKTFSAWNTQKDGKGKSVAANGDITNLISDGGEITLYAIWDQDMVACEPGYYYVDGVKTRCELGKFCAGGTEIPAGSSGCSETCPAGGATIVDGASSITQCRKTAIAGDMTFDFGTAMWDCAYTNGSGDSAVYRTDCKSVALTCDAGYFYNGVGNACIPVTDGYYSPAPTSGGDVEEPASKKAHACPGETGASDDGIGSDQPRAKITDCYSLCALTPADVEHSTTVTPDDPKSFSTTNGQYPACSYTIKCDTGYTPQNGTSPMCVANKYTITLDKNQGTGNATSYVECTFDSGACKLPASTGLTRAGYVTANKWCTNANGSGVCYDADAVTTANISATGTDVTLYAAWNPGVFKIELVANDATENKTQSPVYLKYTVGWFENEAGTKAITTIDTSALPGKPGYNFAGYSTGDVMIVDAMGALQTTNAALRVTTVDTVANVNWSKGNTICEAGYYYGGNGGECTVCEENHWCPGGTFPTDTGIVGGHELCPDGGISAGGVNAKDAGVCYKQGLSYTSATGKASGTQTCNYDSDADEYNAACRDQSVKACVAGYYYVSGIDCTKVGQNYFSGNGDLKREACPENGLTGTLETAGVIDDCYKTVDYKATYGAGTQVCNYTSTNDDGSAKYATNCRDMYITSCQGGYYRENADAIDCKPVGFDAYSVEGSLDRIPCPDGGDTNNEQAATPQSCFKSENPFKSEHGEGYYYCSYSTDTGEYSVCDTEQFTKCDAGYYWAAIGDKDCTKVGYGFFGPVADSQNEGRPTSRQGCATFDGQQGYTETETSADASACYMTEMPCTVANGSGIKTCGYNTSAEDYSADCVACQVDTCDEKYHLTGNKCELCPAGSVCGIETRTGFAGVANAEPQLCSALFNGRYPQSDAGSVDVAQCFGTCDKSANVTTTVGRDYQGANMTDTCEIKVCDTKYYLEDDKSQCTLCPENSICDAASGADMDLDGKPDNTPHTCDELTSGTHTLANAGSTKIEQCYATCEDYEIVYGMAIRDFDTVQYDDVCTYKGISDTKNPCEIQKVNGVETCVEVSCNPDYELINGRCQKCNRAEATEYKPNGNCLVAKCHTGYHPEGDQCATDVKTCSAPNATEATQTWDSKVGAFGICKITECADGYHVEANACVLNTEVCDVEHGTGTREWDERRGVWGDCVATSCAPGYTNDSYESDEPNKQCGRCRNAKSVLGQDAVSSYASGCTIATCMYQGELYNLENNECVPICPINTYEDETGTMRWNPKTKKCERECFDGYMSW